MVRSRLALNAQYAQPEEFKAKGNGDVGRRIARLAPNEGLCFGRIVRFEFAESDTEERKPVEDDSWFILYDDGDEEEVGMQDVEEAFQLAKREELYDNILNQEAVMIPDAPWHSRVG